MNLRHPGGIADDDITRARNLSAADLQ